MEDRRLHHQRDVGRIGRGARIDRRGGEADLVVDDEMDGAAGAEALGAAHRETFGDHALPRERRIAMQQQRQHAGARFHVAQLILLGARLAEHDGIDRFQMRRVRRQRQMHFVVVELAVARCAEVIFHVARALHIGGLGAAALEFVEDLAIGLAHHIGEHVQPPAMGHAETISFTPSWPPRLMICSSAGIVASPPSSPKRLVPTKRTPAEFLEAFGFDQLVEDRALAFGREGNLLVRALRCAAAANPSARDR